MAHSSQPRSPDAHTPPSIHFTGGALHALDQPRLQHATDLQIAKGNGIELEWAIVGAFTSASIDSMPAGYGPTTVSASGKSGPITVAGDVTYRLNVTMNGTITQQLIRVHSHEQGEPVSSIVGIHPPHDESQDVEEDALLNCDLCILAYQLYHQSVIWPLDPWYEVLARGGTSRRDHFMEHIHEFAKTLADRSNELYGGPAVAGALGTSNRVLDPVLSNYGGIRPRDPAITGDGEVYMALRAPAYIVDRVRKASVAFYTGPWQAEWPHGPTAIREIIDYGNGNDELIAFEGGTGTFDAKAAAYSLMGYVLKRTRDDGSWDAHIAFRGSRSGNATRAALMGLQGSGNADWVSDTASTLGEDPYYKATVSKGFGAALKRCMGPLRAALLNLHQKYGPPASIQVTGHSLGAALASLCSSALIQGVPGERLAVELPGWRFSKLRGYFNALPPAGSQACAAQFLKLTGDRTYAPYIAGDIVVQNSRSLSIKEEGAAGYIVRELASGGYSLGRLDRMPRPHGSTDLDNSHEMTLIRAGLVDKRIAKGKTVSDPVKNASPWGYFVTFADLLEGKPVNFIRGEKPLLVTQANLRQVLANYRFAAHFRFFLNKLVDVVSDPGSYRGFHREKDYKLAAERFALAAQMAATPIDAKDPAAIVDAVATQAASLFGFHPKKHLLAKGWRAVKEAAREVSGVGLEIDDLLGDDFCARIGLGLVLATFEEHVHTTLDQYASVPELKLCLEASLGDASKGQKKAEAHGGRAQ